ncbi:MAG: putative rane protein [Pseudonocardiales bacterium]|nr:putative rane protein [Pseudonocardiales bacterium]
MSSSSDRRARGAERRFGPRALLAPAGVLLAALLLTALVVFARSRSGAVHDFDVDTVDDLNRYARGHPGQVQFWKAVTTVGGPTTWRVLAAVAAAALLVRRQWRLAVLIAVTMVGAAILSGVTKSLVHRARPVVPMPVAHVGGGSFPSGHALTSFVAVGLAVVLLVPVLSAAWRVVLIVVGAVVVLAVGFSRLILGVHYVTDVLGGWLIGGLWLAVVMAGFGLAAGGRRSGIRAR